MSERTWNPPLAERSADDIISMIAEMRNIRSWSPYKPQAMEMVEDGFKELKRRGL